MENKLIEQKITDTLELNYMPYAMSVIISRAIPEIDGFKPSHRKLLYTMYKMGLLNGGRTKSTNVVGQTMKLNPHGDQTIYETMVRLTRGNDALLHPFIDSKGNFGKVYSRDMAYAASRYTEVKLDSICNEIFKNIDKDTVDFVDNYDGTLKEPILFPTTYPNILVTPNQGIAVSMASSMASFNLKEVCLATIAYIKNKNVDIKKYLKAPDFSTGGEIIYNADEMDKIYETGRGSFKIRAKYRYDKKNSLIEIYEIPYTTTIEIIIDKIIMLVKSNKLKEINDVRNETDLSGLKLTIDIKRNANPDLLMTKLFSMTPLLDSFSCNFNLLIDSRPMTLGIKSILDNWLKFRVGCIKRQCAYDLNKKTEKYHLLSGLAQIMLDIDKAIKIIRETEQEADVIPNLMQGFQIDKAQAEFVAEIKLRNLNKEYILRRINERTDLAAEIINLKELMSNDELIYKLICDELREIAKKYGKDRKTDIIYEEEIREISKEEFIEDYPVTLFLTRENYFKKITNASLRSASEQKLKENDVIIQQLETTNKKDILFFSDKQNVYKARCYDLGECKASGLGEYFNNILDMEQDEKIVFMVATTDYEGLLVFAYENGKMSKVPLKAYETKTFRKKLINGFSGKSNLVGARHIMEDTDFVLIRDTDKAMLVNTSLIPLKTTKSTGGIQVFKLKKKSYLTKILNPENFDVEEREYFRSTQIPSTGHFIREKDKK